MAIFINTTAQKNYDRIKSDIELYQQELEKIKSSEGVLLSPKEFSYLKIIRIREKQLKQIETEFTQIVDTSIEQRFKLRITTADKAENDEIEKAVRYSMKKVFFLSNVSNLDDDQKNKLMLQQIEQKLSSHDVGLSGSHIWIHNSSHERVAIITKLY